MDHGKTLCPVCDNITFICPCWPKHAADGARCNWVVCERCIGLPKASIRLIVPMRQPPTWGWDKVAFRVATRLCAKYPDDIRILSSETGYLDPELYSPKDDPVDWRPLASFFARAPSPSAKINIVVGCRDVFERFYCEGVLNYAVTGPRPSPPSPEELIWIKKYDRLFLEVDGVTRDPVEDRLERVLERTYPPASPQVPE